MIVDRVDTLGLFAESQLPADIRDGAGVWIYVNDAFCRRFGVTPTDAIGRTPAQCLDPAVAEALTCGDDHVLADDQATDADVTLAVAGETRLFRIHKFPVRDQAGTVFAVAAITMDVTESHRLNQRLKFASVRERDRFENSPIPMTEEDWSGARQVVDRLVVDGVTDLRDHVRDHPEILTDLVAGARIVDVNAAAVRTYRAPDRDALIRHFNTPPDLRSYNPATGLSDIFVSLLEHFRHGASHHVLEGPDTAYDGSEIHIRTTTSITPGHERDWGRVLQTVEDFTARKQAEDALRESEERYAVALKGAKDGIWDWDLSLDRFHASEQTTRIPGLERFVGTMRSQQALAFISPDDRDRLLEKVGDHLRGEAPVLIMEARVLRPGGPDVWVLIRGAGVRDPSGRVTRLAGSITDISERKAFERELKRARDVAELASQAKSRFLANMSHELRTPLNAILGFAQAMEMELFGRLGADRYREYAGHIASSADHLLEVINDVLDMSKVEANEMALNPTVFDLAAGLERCLRLVADAAERKAIRLTSTIRPGDLTIRADERLVRQIFLNLLTNAVKYTPDGGAVDVGAHHLPDGSFEVRVVDTGIGMAPQDIAKAMEPFVQVHSKSYEITQGTGLGLPLVQRMVTLHEGKFRVESAIGKGTRAIVHLPASRLVASKPAA